MQWEDLLEISEIVIALLNAAAIGPRGSSSDNIHA